MEDFSEDKIPERNNIFSNEPFNLVKKDESIKLELRKKFINDYLKDFRKKERLKNKTNFEIDPSKLSIPQEYLNFKLTDLKDENQFQTLLFMLCSNNLACVKFGVYSLRNFICGLKSDKGFVSERKEIDDALISLFLNNKILDYELKYEIYWIIINSTENNEYLLSLIDNESFIGELEKDFSLNNENLNEMIIWLCCHLLEDSKIFFKKFSKSNIFNQTVKNLTQKIQKIDYISSLTVQSLKLIHVFIIREKNEIDQIPINIIKDIVTIMVKFSDELIHEEIRIHLLFTLYLLLDNDIDNIKTFTLKDQHLLKNIMNFNFNSQLREIRLLIRIIGNLLRGKNDVVDYLLTNFNVIDYLLRTYRNFQNDLIHQEILWCLKNLTAGSFEHIMQFLSSEFYLISRDCLNSNNSLTQNISLKIFNNIICMDLFDISMKIINEELLLVLIKVLSEKNLENKSISLSLLDKIFLLGKFTKNSTIHSENTNNVLNDINFDIKPDNENYFINFFLKNEGKEALMELQYDVNNAIYEKSKLIIEKYFAFEEQY